MATTTPTNRATAPGQGPGLFRQGVADMWALALGYVPMGIAIGATIATAPLDRLAGWSGGPIIAAGTAHLTLVELLAAGATLITAASTAIIINARLVAYSAGLAPWFRHESAAARLLIAVFVIDPTYVVAAGRFERDDPGPDGRRRYFLGMGATLFPTWSAAIAVGVVAGDLIPEELELTAAAPLMMAGMLALSTDRLDKAASGALGIVLGVVHVGLPAHTVPLAVAGLVVVATYALTPSRTVDVPAAESAPNDGGGR